MHDLTNQPKKWNITERAEAPPVDPPFSPISLPPPEVTTILNLGLSSHTYLQSVHFIILYNT